MRWLRALACAVILSSAAGAQDPVQGPPPPPAQPPAAAASQGGSTVLPLPQVSLKLGGGTAQSDSVSTAVEIMLMMTVLTLAPGIVITLTSFTRIVIVLSFMRRAMTIQELPPNIVVTGLAFFLTLFIMRPVLTELNTEALQPYRTDAISLDTAVDRASDIMTDFLLKQTREKDLALIYELSGEKVPSTPKEVPFLLVVPAFALSEVKTAFEMGFMILLPFLVIDLVISSILISMGMFMLPPPVISTPCKLLLFVLVDGWNLVIRSVAQSFLL